MAVNFDYEQLYQNMQKKYTESLKYYKEQNYHKAIEYLQKTLGTCEILEDTSFKEDSSFKEDTSLKEDASFKAEILYHLGNAYLMLNSGQDFQLAEEYYQELLQMGEQNYYHQVQLNRARALVLRGEYQSALNIFDQSPDIELILQIEVWRTKAFAYMNLGKFSNQTYFKQALKYCNQIIAAVDADFNTLYFAHHNLGHIYAEIGDYTKAILAFQDGLEFCAEKTKRYETYVDLAIVHTLLAQYELAKAYIEKAQRFFEKSKMVLGIASCLYAKGKMKKQIGTIAEATNYFELALSGYREKEYYYGIVKTFFELFEIYKRINSEKAELYYEQYKFYLNYIYPMDEECLD